MLYFLKNDRLVETVTEKMTKEGKSKIQTHVFMVEGTYEENASEEMMIFENTEDG